MRIASTVAILALACAGLSGETRIVSITTGGKTTTASTEIRRTAEGDDLRVEEEGESGISNTLLAADGTAKSAELRGKDGTVLMVSDGATVTVSGSWKDKPLAGSYELKGLGFYGQGIEFAARAFALGGGKSLKFPMIQPAKPSKAMVMELTKEGTAQFKGKEATKVKIAPSGAMSVFWSAHLLIDERGLILRYEGNRGPGTATIVSELVEVKE